MHVDTVLAARRTALVIVFVYVLWLLAPRLFSFGSRILKTKERNDTRTAARQSKLSAPELVRLLEKDKAVAPDAGLRCVPAPQGWDYLCDYIPTPKESRVRVRFGVMVDAERWIDVSQIVPMQADVPPPERLTR